MHFAQQVFEVQSPLHYMRSLSCQSFLSSRTCFMPLGWSGNLGWLIDLSVITDKPSIAHACTLLRCLFPFLRGEVCLTDFFSYGVRSNFLTILISCSNSFRRLSISSSPSNPSISSSLFHPPFRVVEMIGTTVIGDNEVVLHTTCSRCHFHLFV